MATPVLTIVPARRTLRDHVGGVEFIADKIEALDDESLTPELRAQLSAELIGALAGTRSKVDAVASTLAMFEAMQSAAQAECDRLAKRAATFARQHQRLSDYVLAVCAASKIDRLDGETSSLKARKNPGRVIVDSAAEVPWDFMRLPEPVPEPEAQPDKKLIAAAIKAGQTVAGCRFEQTVRLVRT
jgi:hypothetical protein